MAENKRRERRDKQSRRSGIMEDRNRVRAGKRWMLGCLAVGLLLTASIGGSYAYFTDYLGRRNSITVAHADMEIEENFVPPKELKVGTNQFKKQIAIKNTGTTPIFVRVYMDFSDSAVRDMSELSQDGKTYLKPDAFEAGLKNDWVYISETDDAKLGGYFYYTEPLAPKKSTPRLLDSIKTTFATADDIVDYQIILYAEVVQTADKNGEPFTSADAYLKAWDEFLP